MEPSKLKSGLSPMRGRSWLPILERAYWAAVPPWELPPDSLFRFFLYFLYFLLDGRYKLVLTMERNSVSQEQSTTATPVIRQFRAEMNPILKDGQTLETVMATDPVNGHVYRVTVTLNVPR